MDQLSTGLVHVGTALNITWANQAAYAQLAVGSMGLVDASLTSLIPELAFKINSMSQTPSSLQISEVYLPKSGLTVDVIISRTSENGYLCELFPITERIRQRQSADKADRQQSISTMARTLAHEIKNPLAGVKAGAQLIAQQSQDSVIARHADMIERGVERIASLLERFADSQQHQKRPINLHQLINETSELVMAECQGTLTIEPDYDPSIPRLLADQDQLNQLFLNLLRNSAQATASVVKITTRIEHSSPIVNPPLKHAVRIVFEDDGSGIPVHLQHRLFLPMVSGHDQGSGFGLAIAQQIARAHDGLIEHQPSEHGAIFVLRLPLMSHSIPEDEHES